KNSSSAETVTGASRVGASRVGASRVGASLLGLQGGGVFGCLEGGIDPRRAHLVFGDLRDGVLGAYRALVDALAAGPVVGNEHRVGANGGDHRGPHGAMPAAALHG